MMMKEEEKVKVRQVHTIEQLNVCKVHLKNKI